MIKTIGRLLLVIFFIAIGINSINQALGESVQLSVTTYRQKRFWYTENGIQYYNGVTCGAAASLTVLRYLNCSIPNGDYDVEFSKAYLGCNVTTDDIGRGYINPTPTVDGIKNALNLYMSENGIIGTYKYHNATSLDSYVSLVKGSLLNGYPVIARISIRSSDSYFGYASDGHYIAISGITNFESASPSFVINDPFNYNSNTVYIPVNWFYNNYVHYDGCRYIIYSDSMPVSDHLLVMPDAIDFGAQYIGHDGLCKRRITITNSSRQNITLNTNVASENFVVERFEKATLAPDESTTALVAYKWPLPIGEYEETLNIQTVESNPDEVLSASIQLKLRVGQYLPPNQCKYCQGNNIAYTSLWSGSIGVEYNGDGTHSKEQTHGYSVYCADCDEEYSITDGEYSVRTESCHYGNAGVCSSCGSIQERCEHGQDFYEYHFEQINHDPVKQNGIYHLNYCTNILYDVCSICGKEALSDSWVNRVEEIHCYDANGICVCGDVGEPSICPHEKLSSYQLLEENVRYKDITEETHVKYANEYECAWCLECDAMCSRQLLSFNTSTIEEHDFVKGVCDCGYEVHCEEHDYIGGVCRICGDMQSFVVIPGEIDFGAQYIGIDYPCRRTITIINNGDRAVTLNTNVESQHFTIGGFDKETIAPGEFAEAYVSFKWKVPVGTYEETVYIQTIESDPDLVLSQTLNLKMQVDEYSMPSQEQCKYCQSDDTVLRMFSSYFYSDFEPVYNGDGTHTAERYYCYDVECNSCGVSYEGTASNKSICIEPCFYDKEGICYICDTPLIKCSHSKETYECVEAQYEYMESKPEMLEEGPYHGISYVVHRKYQCKICGEEYRETRQIFKPEAHHYNENGICACGAEGEPTTCQHDNQEIRRYRYYEDIMPETHLRVESNSLYLYCLDCDTIRRYLPDEVGEEKITEEHVFMDGVCACGYRIGCETHEFVNGVCSICGRPDLDSMNATLTLPANIKNIEMGAFTGSAAEAIIVPDGCLTIGERAFAQSEALKCVVLPGSVIEIAEDAFEGCVDLVIFAPQNSAAHIYAQKYGYIWYEK